MENWVRVSPNLGQYDNIRLTLPGCKLQDDGRKQKTNITNKIRVVVKPYPLHWEAQGIDKSFPFSFINFCVQRASLKH
jgi:hypothetical protein